jgi:hypothetical protein
MDAGNEWLEERAALLDEIERLREVERAAIEFCDRCRAGEIRSSHTYRRFRSALGRAREPGAVPGTAQPPASIRRDPASISHATAVSGR